MPQPAKCSDRSIHNYKIFAFFPLRNVTQTIVCTSCGFQIKMSVSEELKAFCLLIYHATFGRWNTTLAMPWARICRWTSTGHSGRWRIEYNTAQMVGIVRQKWGFNTL